MKEAIEIEQPLSTKHFSAEETERAINQCIAAELDAITMYQQVASSISDPKLKKLLLDIVKEEQIHQGEFIEALASISSDADANIEQGRKEASEIIEEHMSTIQLLDDLDSFHESFPELKNSSDDPKTKPWHIICKWNEDDEAKCIHADSADTVEDALRKREAARKDMKSKGIDAVVIILPLQDFLLWDKSKPLEEGIASTIGRGIGNIGRGVRGVARGVKNTATNFAAGFTGISDDQIASLLQVFENPQAAVQNNSQKPSEDTEPNTKAGPLDIKNTADTKAYFDELVKKVLDHIDSGQAPANVKTIINQLARTEGNLNYVNWKWANLDKLNTLGKETFPDWTARDLPPEVDNPNETPAQDAAEEGKK